MHTVHADRSEARGVSMSAIKKGGENMMDMLTTKKDGAKGDDNKLPKPSRYDGAVRYG